MHPEDNTPRGDALGCTPDRAPPPAPALFAELGWPADANWVRITCAGAAAPSPTPVPAVVQLAWPVRPTWSLRYCFPASIPGAYLSPYAGYRFELLGLLDSLVLGPSAAAPPSSLPWPWCWRDTGVVQGTKGLRLYAYTVQLWRQRAWYRDSSLCAELRWHPLHGEHHGIIIPADYAAQGDARQRALAAADRGLRFLRQLPLLHGGRPDDTGEYRADEGDKFLAALRPIAVQVVKGGESLNITSIAGSWEKSRKWIRKYCNLFGINLATLEAEIREELGL